MACDTGTILATYAAGAARHPSGRPAAADAAQAWAAVQLGSHGRLGCAVVRDSARREWRVEAHRDPARGRYLVLRPAHGDLEPLRASADGHRPDAYLPIDGAAWTLLALLVAGQDGGAGRDDPELRDEAFRTVDRIVRDAQHLLLMGAADDEDP